MPVDRYRGISLNQHFFACGDEKARQFFFLQGDSTKLEDALIFIRVKEGIEGVGPFV